MGYLCCPHPQKAHQLPVVACSHLCIAAQSEAVHGYAGVPHVLGSAVGMVVRDGNNKEKLQFLWCNNYIFFTVHYFFSSYKCWSSKSWLYKLSFFYYGNIMPTHSFLQQIHFLSASPKHICNKHSLIYFQNTLPKTILVWLIKLCSEI